jgi:hypothetical protein
MKQNCKIFPMISALVTALTLAAATAAHAEPIGIVHTGVTSNGLNWDHHYALVLTAFPEEQIQNPLDFISVIDFNGFVAIASTPANWVGSTELQTFVPSPVGSIPVVDSAGILNVRFDYTGLLPVTAGVYLDYFIITSTQGLTEDGNFGASYHSSLAIGPPYRQVGTVGATLVPQAAAVPEPWNVISVIATMIPVGLFYLGRKHRQVK